MRRPRPSILTCVITLLVVVTLGCGLLGYARAVHRLPDGIYSQGGLARFLDYLYLSLLLLTMSGRNTFGDHFLMVGRWTGALFAFVTVLKLAVPRLESALRGHLMQWLGDHTIVVGQGDRGRCFLRDIARAEGDPPLVGARRCVGIDLASVDRESLDDNRPGRRIRRSRVHLIQGDATDPTILRRAGLRSAVRVIIVAKDDLTNLEITRQILAEIARRGRRRRHLDLIVHLSQPALRLEGPSLLEAPERVSIRPFSLPALAARTLQAHWLFAAQARLQGAAGAHLVLVGYDDAYAEELLLSLLRLGALSDQKPPTVTVFTKDPIDTERRLQRNYPAARTLASSFEVLAHFPGVDLTREEMAAVEVRGKVTALVVTAATDTQAMALAHRLRGQAHRFAVWRAPLFVHTERPAEFAQNFSACRNAREIAEVFEPFGDIETLCSLRGLQDWHEELAIAIHEGYLAERLPGEEAPAAISWRDVSEEYREANRRVVDHFPLLLATAGYIVRGSPLLPAAPLVFSAEQMHTLARLEHQSWSAERLLGGWQFGQPRDDRNKRHDCLVAFEELGPMQQRDVSQIQRMTRLLEGAARAHTPRPTVFRERTIGLVGHNVLSREQARWVLTRASQMATEQLRCAQRLGRGGEFWTLVTPLAPGSDLLLTQAVCGELERCSEGSGGPRRFRVLIASPGTPEQLAAAYLRSDPPPQATPDGHATLEDLLHDHDRPNDRRAVVASLLRDFIDGLTCCEWVIDLRPPAATGPLIADQDFAACDDYVLSRCDELIVVLDTQRYGLVSGFNAEQWRQLPHERFKKHGSGALVWRWLQQRPDTTLHVIDVGAEEVTRAQAAS